MKIKEAARVCGLTEKAIRLYEAKGLIHPPMQEKNGRLFRDYDKNTLQALQTIGLLRRASFTLEQIGTMQKDPAAIPTVLSAYRETVNTQAAQFEALCQAAEALRIDIPRDLSSLAARLAPTALDGETLIRPASDSRPENEPPTHFRLWDEDITAEEKEKAYSRFLKKQARKEAIETVLFAIPRGIAALLSSGRRKMAKQPPTLSMKWKHLILPLLIFALLLVHLSVTAVRTEHRREHYVREVVWSLRESASLLETAVTTETYGEKQSEQLLKHLVTLVTLLPLGEADASPSSATDLSALTPLALIDVLGCRYAATINGVPTAGILYDGLVSKAEWQFLALLSSELNAMIAPLLDNDGLNRRADLGFEELRRTLQPFLLRFGSWSFREDSPYRLLLGED